MSFRKELNFISMGGSNTVVLHSHIDLLDNVT